MINNDMALYEFEALDGELDEYGQPTKKTKGSILMAIYPTDKEVQDNINYAGARYLGLTRTKIDDSYIITYGKQKLKVLYIIEKGRLTQVFMNVI